MSEGSDEVVLEVDEPDEVSNFYGFDKNANLVAMDQDLTVVEKLLLEKRASLPKPIK